MGLGKVPMHMQTIPRTVLKLHFKTFSGYTSHTSIWWNPHHQIPILAHTYSAESASRSMDWTRTHIPNGMPIIGYILAQVSSGMHITEYTLMPQLTILDETAEDARCHGYTLSLLNLNHNTLVQTKHMRIIRGYSPMICIPQKIHNVAIQNNTRAHCDHFSRMS